MAHEDRNESTSSTHFRVFEGSNVTLLRHMMNVKAPVLDEHRVANAHDISTAFSDPMLLYRPGCLANQGRSTINQAGVDLHHIRTGFNLAHCVSGCHDTAGANDGK